MYINIPAIVFFILVAIAPLSAQHKKTISLPATLQPSFLFQPLGTCEDFVLQNALRQKVSENPKWKLLAQQERLAIGIVDLSDPFNIKYAHLNGRTMMYAASLPKIGVLLAATDALEKGELPESKEVLQDMRLMIAKSNNQATTRLIDRLGYKKIANVLKDPKYSLYNEKAGGGIWVGKRYAASGPRNPDPIKGLSHAATVEQVCRFYYLMAFGKLVSKERSLQMMEMMVNPELHHKFVNTLDKVAPEATVFRKSGSWKNFHSDSAMVLEHGWRKYILVALVEDPEGEILMREMVTIAEEVLRENQPLTLKN